MRMRWSACSTRSRCVTRERKKRSGALFSLAAGAGRRALNLSRQDTPHAPAPLSLSLSLYSSQDHFAKSKPTIRTPEQLAASREALLQHVPEAARANLPESVLEAAAAGGLGMVENVALLTNAPAHGFVGINLYCDDEAGALGAPLNPRACEIASVCGKQLQVKGDAFLARVMDSDKEFERQDFLLAEVSSSAPWVKAAEEQARSRAARGESAEAVMRRLGAGGGVVGGAAKKAPAPSLPPPPPPPPLTPAASARAEGNARFAAGDWAAAIALYTKAAELCGEEEGAQMERAAALNNRAAARLRAGDAAGAAADASWVLGVEPSNVKALLRRGAAREALGQAGGAGSDFEQAATLEPTNAQAAAGLARGKK